MNKRTYILLLLDTVLVAVSFYISALFKRISFADYFCNNFYAIIIFCVILLVTSLYFNKYVFKVHSHWRISLGIIKSHFVAIAVAIMLMYIFGETSYSRIMVFLTVVNVTVLDLVVYNIWVSLKRARLIPDDILGLDRERLSRLECKNEEIDPERQRLVKESILSRYSQQILNFIETNVSVYSEKTLVLYTQEVLNVQVQPSGMYNNVVNLSNVNNHRFVNKFFEAVNSKIPLGGIYICMAETQEQRKKRLLKKYPPVLNRVYYFFDFVFKRLFPKFKLTKRLYFFLTRGQNRVISLAELLGRLYSCGFSVLADVEIEGITFVVSQKIGEPSYDMEPTYGPLIMLKRVGKKGKIIKVFKFRTMHPYSEYLQEYIYNHYNLQDGGKFKNDFRVTTMGKFMRKLWIDEWPMFLNVFKGEMKIVGVRPLSRHYFSLYSKEMQDRRIKYKPGLVPPFYVDNPKTIDEIMDSERRYFDACDKHPFFTDIRYFFLSFYNIVFRKLRSS